MHNSGTHLLVLINGILDFSRNPAARGAGGTGLGVAISKKFVELHVGRLWADSCEKQGSTFHFTLPVN